MSPPDAGADFSAMERLKAGDDLALNEIMARWQRRVTGFLLRMTGNEAVALDLAQETFVRVYQARARFQPKAEFSTWLFTIAANLGRHHFRWQRRHPAVSLEGEESIGPTLFANAASPSEGAARNEQAALVAAAVMALPEDLREAVVLFEYEGLSQKQIAVIAGCTPKAIETRLYRARLELRERLAKYLNLP